MRQPSGVVDSLSAIPATMSVLNLAEHSWFQEARGFCAANPWTQPHFRLCFQQPRSDDAIKRLAIEAKPEFHAMFTRFPEMPSEWLSLTRGTRAARVSCTRFWYTFPLRLAPVILIRHARISDQRLSDSILDTAAMGGPVLRPRRLLGGRSLRR